MTRPAPSVRPLLVSNSLRKRHAGKGMTAAHFRGQRSNRRSSFRCAVTCTKCAQGQAPQTCDPILNYRIAGKLCCPLAKPDMDLKFLYSHCHAVPVSLVNVCEARWDVPTSAFLARDADTYVAHAARAAMVNGADTAETDSDTEAAQEVAQEALGLGGENFAAGAGSAALQVRATHRSSSRPHSTRSRRHHLTTTLWGAQTVLAAWS